MSSGVHDLNAKELHLLVALWHGSPAAAAPRGTREELLEALWRKGLLEWAENDEGERVPDVSWEAVCELRRRGFKGPQRR